jgi:hypothetical protein
MEIPTLREGRRGCGYRTPGGLYLVGGEAMEACAKLPIECSTCPICGQGVKPARGWTWVDGDTLAQPEPHGTARHRAGCPLARPIGRCGLLWVGERFYRTPQAFMSEALAMGVSRRITQVPKGLEPGRTLVLFGHRSAVSVACPRCGDEAAGSCGECEDGFERRPGIFSAFVPRRIEYIVRGDEAEDELAALVERGIQPVHVERVEDAGSPNTA